MSTKPYVPKYCMIFRKDVEGNGHFQFIIDSEKEAIQFCQDFPEYFYMTRNAFMEYLASSTSNPEKYKEEEEVPANEAVEGQ